MNMRNLLKETKEVLKENKKTLKDVLWCGSEEYGWFDIDVFEKLADKEYDGGYGAQEVAKDLVLVGKDFWLERDEYHGSEWWDYKTTPKKPKKNTIPTTLIKGMWESLTEMNTPTTY